MGIIMTILLGIAGSFLAGIIGQSIGWYKAGEGAGFIASVNRRDYPLGDLRQDQAQDLRLRIWAFPRICLKRGTMRFRRGPRK